jgi:hypothetical protein
MVLRNADGIPTFMACQYLDDCKTPLEAELRVCEEELVLASQHSRLPIIVESGNTQLVDAARSSSLDSSPFRHLINEIRHLASQNSECVFLNVKRVQ